MITGGTGSFGNTVLKRFLSTKVKEIRIFSRDEKKQEEMRIALNNPKLKFYIGDVRDFDSTYHAMKGVDYVFHAAALKQVPSCEFYPMEAVRTNVIGTENVMNAASANSVKRVVVLSTDKAVYPINAMGISKAMAEKVLVAKSRTVRAKGPVMCATRYGNVMGSNGSVIPIFKKQLERGGPVTVTHPDITRYFMTIPEACQLVLEAGTIGQGGEIFIFDMGQSVKIVDLVRKMIKLYGLTEGKDIEIEFTGLRPGEKLYEELLNDQENTLPTHHPQIMRATVQEFDHAVVRAQVDELIQLFSFQNNNEIVAYMKTMVPEYKSNNSIFEQLD